MAAAQNFVTVTRRPPDVEDYIDMLRRYRSWLIGPLFAGLVIAVVVAFLWPDTYVSQAVLRITPQQISDRLVPQVVNMLLNSKDQLLRAAYYETARNSSKIENYLARGVLENAGKTK